MFNRDRVNILDKLFEVSARAKSVIQGMNKQSAQEELNISRPNFIVNGDHQVNQRGLLPVTGMTSGTYETTDRWKTVLGTISGAAGLNSGWLRATATSDGTGYIGFYQLIEYASSLAGKTITVSAKVRSNHNKAGFHIFDGYGRDVGKKHTGDGSEQLLTATIPLASNITILNIYLFIYNNGATPITSGDYIEFTNVKLEIGDTATPFEVEPYAEVLRKCGTLPLAGNHFPERYIDGTAGYDDANDNSSCVLLHKLGQGMGFLLHGGFGFQSWTGDAHFNGVISCIYNTDAVFSSVSRIDDTNKGSIGVSLVTVTYKGTSWLALKKIGGATGTFYTGGCYIDSPTLQERSPVTVADSDVTVTTTHSTL